MKKQFFVVTFFCFALSLMAFSTTSAQDAGADRLLGMWLPSNEKAHVEIYKGAKTGRFFGRLAWLDEPNDPSTGKPRTDVENPDKDKRDTPLLNYVILRGFKYNEDDGVWEDGTIYDPQKGKTYNCIIKMPDNNTIEVRGYIGISLLGRTDVWTRIKGTDK